MGKRKKNLPTRRRVPEGRDSPPAPQPGPTRPAFWFRRHRAWLLGIAVVILLATGAAYWRTVAPDDQPQILSGPGGPGQIATVDAPDIHALLVDPADPDHVYFGSHGGIQESHDGGFTWAAGNLSNVDAMSLSASAPRAETIFVFGHNVAQVSHDQGKSWHALEHDLPDTDIHAVAHDPADPDRLYVDLPRVGMFTSSNGGENWTQLATQPPGGPAFALATSGSRLYAATEAGIAVTEDQGTRWSLLKGQPPRPIVTLTRGETEQIVLYAGTEQGLFASADGGTTWTLVGLENIQVLAAAVAPSDPLRVYVIAKGGGVYRSDDGGLTWRESPIESAARSGVE